jgi:hypothetical protein
MSISPEKEKAVAQRMARLGISEDDLRETFIRSSGPASKCQQNGNLRLSRSPATAFSSNASRTVLKP